MIYIWWSKFQEWLRLASRWLNDPTNLLLDMTWSWRWRKLPSWQHREISSLQGQKPWEKVVSKEVWLQILKPNFQQNGDEKYEKQSGESERSRREKRRREKEKESKKEDTGARNVRKAAKQCVFPMICGLESKVGSGKWGLRRHLGKWEMKKACRCGSKHISKSKCANHLNFAPLLGDQMPKKCTPLWREAHFEVTMHTTHHVWITFGSSDVGKLHAVV